MPKSVDTYEGNRAKLFVQRSDIVPGTRGLLVALDDGLISGVSPRGIGNSDNLLKYPDATLRGIRDIATGVIDFPPKFFRFAADWPRNVAMVTNVSGSIEGQEHLDKVLLVEPEEALEEIEALAALDNGTPAGISFHYNHTSRFANEQIRDGRRIGNVTRQAGLEFVGHGYPRRMVRRWQTPWKLTESHYRELPGEDMSLREYTDKILDTESVLVDLGVTTAKLPRPGRTPSENLDMAGEIVDFGHRNGIKVVFAGGLLKSVPDSLGLIESDMQAGADGEAIGRNYFRRLLGSPEQPEQHARQYLLAAEHIIFHGLSAEEAIEFSGVNRAA